MTISRFHKSITVIAAAGVLALGFGPTATAAATPEVPAAATNQATNQAQALAALKQIVTTDNIDQLLAQVSDADAVRQLTEVRDELTAARTQDIDIIGELKKFAKWAQPIIVNVLRIGGSLAASLVRFLPSVIGLIPGVGPIAAAVVEPVALLVEHGSALLADLIEQIQIEGVPQDQAQRMITEYLESNGIPPLSAGVFGQGLAYLFTV